MTPKTKVQPPSFFAPNGEEYLSRDHYVAHVRKQRERELQRRKKEEESLRALVRCRCRAVSVSAAGENVRS